LSTVLDLKSGANNVPLLIRQEPAVNEATGSLVIIYVLTAGHSAHHCLYAKGLNRLRLLAGLPAFLEFDPQQPGIHEPLEQRIDGDFHTMHQAQGER